MKKYLKENKTLAILFIIAIICVVVSVVLLFKYFYFGNGGSKYGTRLESDDCDNYNFMGRTITPISSIHNIFGQNTNGNNILLIVVITSITVASAIGLFFIIKRRKHN